MLPIVTSILPIVGKVLDRVIPDPEARAKAERELLTMTQSQEIKEMEVQLSAIIAEAQSEDPWTSRARPSFLYVVYTYILAAIPFAFMAFFNPELGGAVAQNVRLWLDSIPEEMWWLFGAGYLGYVGARTIDKRNRNKNAR